MSKKRLEWLIIGGGVHGVHIAARLLGEGAVRSQQLRLIDPHHALLQRWHMCTATTGMKFLRSPVVHHLDLSPWSLKQYAKKYKNKGGRSRFTAPYDRPSLQMFNEHCQHVIKSFKLDELHISARALNCQIDCDGVSVQLSTSEEVCARRVVLALGASEELAWPEWAPTSHPKVQHIFGLESNEWPTSPERVAVIGGGISAAQVALRLTQEGHQVDLVSRHPLREHQFDSDPGWLGSKLMASFDQERDVERRRAMIVEARHKGSVPPDVRQALKKAISKSQLTWREGEVNSLHERDASLVIQGDRLPLIMVDRVMLATGFSSQRPGGSLIDNLITSASLPCARCGYPIIDRALRWHPSVYVTGPLAELELGPSARNISGARRAADRLVSVARAVQKSDHGVT